MSLAEQKLNAVARAFAFAMLCFVDFAYSTMVDVFRGIKTSVFIWPTFRMAILIAASSVALCGNVAATSDQMIVKCRCERADADRGVGCRCVTGNFCLWGGVISNETEGEKIP